MKKKGFYAIVDEGNCKGLVVVKHKDGFFCALQSSFPYLFNTYDEAMSAANDLPYAENIRIKFMD